MRAFSMLLLGLSATVCAGCAREMDGFGRRYRLGQAEPVVREMVEHYGGAAALESISEIRADAVVTTYEQGVQRISAQALAIYPNQRRIVARSHRPDGSWRAQVDLDGGARFSTTGELALSDAQRRRIAEDLRLILHRVRGPMNLLNGGERIAEMDASYQAGYDLVRLLVSGRPGVATAYFVDEQARELRFVTAGGYNAGDAGTVTILTNERVGGVIVPVRMQVVRIGRIALIGQEQVLDVQLTGVTVR